MSNATKNIKGKPIKDLLELVSNKRFKIPPHLANDRDQYGQPSVFVMISGKATYIPVDRWVAIEYNVYCLLKDVGIIGRNTHYEEGEDFDPFA